MYVYAIAHVFMSVVMTAWGSGNVCCVATVIEDSGVLKYVICLLKGCDGCVFCLYCDTWSCWSSCMGSMSISSYRYLCLGCILWQFS